MQLYSSRLFSPFAERLSDCSNSAFRLRCHCPCCACITSFIFSVWAPFHFAKLSRPGIFRCMLLSLMRHWPLLEVCPLLPPHCLVSATVWGRVHLLARFACIALPVGCMVSRLRWLLPLVFAGLWFGCWCPAVDGAALVLRCCTHQKSLVFCVLFHCRSPTAHCILLFPRKFLIALQASGTLSWLVSKCSRVDMHACLLCVA